MTAGAASLPAFYLVLGAGLAAYLHVGVGWLGSESVSTRAQGHLAVQFAGTGLAVCVACLAVLLWRGVA